MKVNLQERLDLYNKKHILVIGDVMLDKYIWGSVDRISPEAPVPVVHVEKTNHHPGGAANVARNIHGLGGRVTLIGLVGEDDSGELLQSILAKDEGIAFNLLTEDARQTTVKTRIIAQGQHVARLDRETNSIPHDSTLHSLKNVISESLHDVDGVILQDYDKGVLTSKLIPWIMEQSKSRSIPVYVDPKKKHFSLFSGARLFKPNLSEFLSRSVNDQDFISAGISFRSSNDFDILMVTQGEEGMSLFLDNDHVQIPTKARAVHDVSGAGDTVIATFSLNDICGADPMESARLSNLAAGRVCEEVGVVPITMESLTDILNHHHD